MFLGFHQGFPRGGRGIVCKSSQSLVDTKSQGRTGGHCRHPFLKEMRLLETAKRATRKPSPHQNSYPMGLTRSKSKPTNQCHSPFAPNAKIPKNSTTFKLFPTEVSCFLHLLPEVQTLLAFHASHRDCSPSCPLLILCSRLPGSC